MNQAAPVFADHLHPVGYTKRVHLSLVKLSFQLQVFDETCAIHSIKEWSPSVCWIQFKDSIFITIWLTWYCKVAGSVYEVTYMELIFKTTVSSAVQVWWGLNLSAWVCASLLCDTNSIFVTCIYIYIHTHAPTDIYILLNIRFSVMKLYPLTAAVQHFVIFPQYLPCDSLICL
jgi:hypothetical protein